MLYLGNSDKEPDVIHLGGKKIREIYRGDTLVWPVSRAKSIVNYSTTLFKIDNKNRLYAAGQGDFGALGLGEGLDRVSVLTKVPGMDDVADVQPVSTGTFVLKNDGSLWSVGTTYGNNLAYGTYGGVTDDLHFSKRYEFWRVDPHNAPANTVMLSSGYTAPTRPTNYVNGHMLIADSDGFIWAVGYNEKGQCGTGTTVSAEADGTRGFLRTPFCGDIKCIGRGLRHSVVVLNDHTLWSCGDNNKGQTGLPSLLAGDSYNAYITVFTKTSLTNVASVSCSGNTTMAVKNDGTLWACGDLSNYRCGLNPYDFSTNGFVNEFTRVNLTNVKKVVLGREHSIALTNDGKVFLAGRNSNGALGYQNENGIWATYQEVIFEEKAVDIAAGYNCTHVALANGALMGTGYNTWGQLGIGNIDLAVYGFTEAV